MSSWEKVAPRGWTRVNSNVRSSCFKKKTGTRGLAKYRLKVNTTNMPEGNDFCEFFTVRLNRSATTTRQAVIASVWFCCRGRKQRTQHPVNSVDPARCGAGVCRALNMCRSSVDAAHWNGVTKKPGNSCLRDCSLCLLLYSHSLFLWHLRMDYAVCLGGRAARREGCRW